MLQNILKKIKKTIESIILCIRFPFLYPRNRFTDLHYNNWKIQEFHKHWYPATQDEFRLNVIKESEKPSLYGFGKRGTTRYRARFEGNSVILCDSIWKVLDRIDNFCDKGKILKVGWKDMNDLCVVVSDDWEGNRFHYITISHSKWLQRIIKFFDWIHKHPLQWIHCIPTYTELDAMPNGWRKAFGLQMCKDIKAQLLKEGGKKALYKYRIMQIKEKYGELRWYDEHSSHEIFNIINKYENLSRRICINCGKPAKWISRGWISPYCDDCIEDKDYADSIKNE